MVREADNKLMKSCASYVGSINPLESLHATLATSGMIAKEAGEELGVTDPLKFVNVEKKAKDEKEIEGGKKKKKKGDLVNALRKKVKGMKI